METEEKLSDLDKKLMCTKHGTKINQLLCKNCDLYVCLDCVTTEHQGHVFDKIQCTGKKIFEALKVFEEKTSSELDKALKILTMGRKSLMDVSYEVENQIISHSKEFQKEKDKTEQSHIYNIHKIKEENNEKISENICKLHKQKQELNLFIKLWTEKLQFSSDELSNKLTTKCENEIKQYSIDIPIMPVIMIPKLYISPIKGALEKMYGTIDYVAMKYTNEGFQPVQPIEGGKSQELRKTGNAANAYNINVQIISSFKCPSYDGPTFAAKDNKSALIGSDDDTFSMIGQNGNVITSVNPRFRVRQAIILPSGDFLIACGLKTRLVKLHKDGKIEPFYNTKPFNPYRISVSDRGHILVCLTACVEDSQVIKLSLSGEKLQTYTSTEDGSPLFEDPGFLLENINGDIWVQDQGYVTVIQEDNKSCFKYAGAPGRKTANLFTPTGLACNKLGQVIVADNANSDIHLVDMDGQFIQYLITNNRELGNPYTLTIDSEGKLWIGCEKKSDKNIFVVKYLSG